MVCDEILIDSLEAYHTDYHKDVKLKSWHNTYNNPDIEGIVGEHEDQIKTDNPSYV